MKIYFILTAVVSIFLLLFPLVMTGVTQSGQDAKGSEAQSSTKELPQKEKAEKIDTIKVLRVSSGKVVDMDIFDYLVGAVASEMPAAYEKEALKAQAVACYTYALWLSENADRSAISGADISDSSESHQGFSDEKELMDKWGDKYEANIGKIKECVGEVLGQYIAFDAKPIIACYHAISPGKTEDALTVWGKDIEYLKSVTAPGDALSPGLDSNVTLSKDEFRQKAKALEGADLSGEAGKWIKNIKRSDAGFVKAVTIAGKDFDGNDIRSAFSLRSPYFTVEYKNDKFVFSVKGYGHGLGMSQYSADYMARQGCSYKDILTHFYSGCEIAG